MINERFTIIKSEFEAELSAVNDSGSVEKIRIKYAGRNGIITGLFALIPGLPAGERREFGCHLNDLKNNISEALKNKENLLSGASNSGAVDDITMPGQRVEFGSVHPVIKTIMDIEEIFVKIGFRVAGGPDIEDDYHNFEALNMKGDHPARDMWDTFYLSKSSIGQNLLRTHTSPVQVRVMEKYSPPFAILMPGRVYRRDSDVTHVPMFHQVEGLYIDRNISMADLKGILEYFAHEMFGPEFGVRLRPSYFPFTEPSCEMDISCVLCKGKGCAVCKGTGWIEILGAGIVHKNVLISGKIDPEEFSGYAFGMGAERITMLRSGADDMRNFFENDIRYLREFK